MKKFLVIFLLIFSAVFYGCAKKEYLKISYTYPGDTRMWDHFFKVEEPYKFKSAPLGIILPHHLIVANEIAKFYDGLTKVINPSLVVILAPNHFEKGVADIQTCQTCIFETTEGEVEIDETVASDLVDANLAVYSDDTFIEEHSIFSHTPFIKHYFPDAKISPILLKSKTSEDEIKNLSNWLNENLPNEDVLVIASVDFSHYQPPEVADFHDQSSFTTISNFDYKNLYDIEIDSPPSIYTFLSLMDLRGYKSSERLANTNLYQYVKEHLEETTSHQFFAFYDGAIKPIKAVSILSFGNIPKNLNDLNLYTGWIWNNYLDNELDKTDKTQTLDYFLKDIRGKEDRFLSGSDFLVFDMPDDECSLQEQNGLKISFCKFVENPDKEKEFLKIIQKQDENSDILYLLYDFNGGDLDENRKFLIRDFVKHGVDIFVGRGLKEVVPFEIYKGSLLFYSLGDFILDNKLVSELNAVSAGMILGLYITPDYYYIYTFPIDVINGYPKLMDFSVRYNSFRYFIQNASLTYHDKSDENKGTIKIKR